SAPAVDLVPLAFLGFALCLLYQRTRSLYPCIVVHALNNSFAFAQLEEWSWWKYPLIMVAALGVIAVAALLLTRARVLSAAPAPAAPAPAPTLKLVVQRAGGNPAFAIVGSRILVRGYVRPYVAAQKVKISLYRDGRRLVVQTFGLAPRANGSGEFHVTFASHD